MATIPTNATRQSEPKCSIERCLLILSDRWSFLIMRESLMGGIQRFADFQRALGIAPNILAARLDRLVDGGVMVKRSYQEPGSRARQSYHLTAAGKDLAVPLAALQQWGDQHNPPRGGPTMLRRTSAGATVRVGFLDQDDKPVRLDELSFVSSTAVAD